MTPSQDRAFIAEVLESPKSGYLFVGAIPLDGSLSADVCGEYSCYLRANIDVGLAHELIIRLLEFLHDREIPPELEAPFVASLIDIELWRERRERGYVTGVQ